MKRNKTVKIAVRIATILLAAALIFGAVWGGLAASRAALHNNVKTVKAESAYSGYAGTSAHAMCTMEASSGRILYAKNENERLPMASTTKIITAIAAIEAAAEQGLDLDAKVKINDKAVGIEGTSIYLQKDEELSRRELLLALMLRSGNDAAVALALSVSPTLDEFYERMRAVSSKAGATDSDFKNPHGLDAEGHFTTAKDLALITSYALNNPVFAEVVKTDHATISGKAYPRAIKNKNRLLRSLDGCIGVKTGFTKKAGRCFVGARNADGMTVVCVVLNCGPMFEECAELLTLASSEYTMQKLIGKDEFINFESSGRLGIGREDFYYPLKNDEIRDDQTEAGSPEFDDIEIKLEGLNAAVFFKGSKIYEAECNVL